MEFLKKIKLKVLCRSYSKEFKKCMLN